MDEEEIGGPAFNDATGLSFLEQLSAADCAGSDRLPWLAARFDEPLDLPRQMVRAQRTAPEVSAGCDPHARAVSEVYALDRALAPMRDPLLPLVADEPRQRSRLREGGPGTKDREGAHEERPLTGHLRDRVRVELESVFDRIDSGIDPDPGPDEETGMRGDLRIATVREFDDGPHVFRRPRRLFLLRSVEVELEEVRPIVELSRRRLQEGGAVVCLDREASREDAAVADPGSRDPDPRSIRVRPPSFPNAEREGAPLSVPRIHGERRPDVAGPAHARAAQEVPVVLRDVEQFVRRISTAVDPKRAAGKGDMAVGIDHAGNDCGSARIDDVDVRREIALIGTRTDPDHVASVDEKAHVFPQRWPTRVGKGRVPIQGRSRRDHRTTPCVVRSTPALEDGVAEPDQRRGRPGPRPPPPGPPGPRGALLLPLCRL